MTCITNNDEDLNHVFAEFEKYETGTGQKLNKEKTEILHLKYRQNYTPTNPRYQNYNKKRTF